MRIEFPDKPENNLALFDGFFKPAGLLRGQAGTLTFCAMGSRALSLLDFGTDT